MLRVQDAADSLLNEMAEKHVTTLGSDRERQFPIADVTQLAAAAAAASRRTKVGINYSHDSLLTLDSLRGTHTCSPGTDGESSQ